MEKFSSKNKQLLISPTNKYLEREDMDPFSTGVIDELLQVCLIKYIIFIYKWKGTNEWRNIQDIIRITIKAVTDVVKTHGYAIKELEKQMTTRVFFY